MFKIKVFTVYKEDERQNNSVCISYKSQILKVLNNNDILNISKKGYSIFKQIPQYILINILKQK